MVILNLKETLLAQTNLLKPVSDEHSVDPHWDVIHTVKLKNCEA